MRKLLGVIFLLSAAISYGQYRTRAQQLVLNNEDSLQAGLNKNKTVVSGYGSAFYQRDFNTKNAAINLERAVLFVGHQFNEKIAVFTELEIEDAKVAGGEPGGEVAMEQAYLKFNLSSRQYLVAGLFVPRIGLLNENHLPVNFNGVERPLVESIVIPATWRELGIGLYGSLSQAPFNYSIALVNGLSSESFEHGSGIREGRFEGRNASANNIAVTASLQYAWKDFKFQLSGYAGGTVGASKATADSLGLKGGAFGTAIYLGEGDMQYNHNAFSAKILAAYISFPGAGKVNTAYNNNTASGMYGAYAELGYNWLYTKATAQQFITFVRAELIDLNASLPAPPKGIYDGTEKQSHIIAGVGYLPIPNVVIRADIRFLHTGKENPALINNAAGYLQNKQFLNIGVGYSF